MEYHWLVLTERTRSAVHGVNVECRGHRVDIVHSTRSMTYARRSIRVMTFNPKLRLSMVFTTAGASFAASHKRYGTRLWWPHDRWWTFASLNVSVTQRFPASIRSRSVREELICG